MKNENFNIDELENAAVNKSNNAKRAAAAAAFTAAGGAMGYGATIAGEVNPDEPLDGLTEDDLNSVTGEEQTADSAEQTSTQEQTVVVEHHYVPVHEVEHEEPEPAITYEKTTHYYDEDHNLLVTTEQGTVDGHNFVMGDVDGDMKADFLAYDVNGDGIYSDNEIVTLRGSSQIDMGHATAQHDDVFIDTEEPAPYHEPEPWVDPISPSEKDELADINNDIEEEKAGETYSNDYAQNTDDYNNEGDTNTYASLDDVHDYDTSSADSDFSESLYDDAPELI